MKKKELQDFVRTILSAPVDGLDWNGKRAFIQNEAFKINKEFNDDPVKKGQPWADDQLRLVLSMPATTDSVCLLAKALGRGHDYRTPIEFEGTPLTDGECPIYWGKSTPKAWRFWFPPLRSGTDYCGRYTVVIVSLILTQSRR